MQRHINPLKNAPSHHLQQQSGVLCYPLLCCRKEVAFLQTSHTDDLAYRCRLPKIKKSITQHGMENGESLAYPMMFVKVGIDEWTLSVWGLISALTWICAPIWSLCCNPCCRAILLVILILLLTMGTPMKTAFLEHVHSLYVWVITVDQMSSDANFANLIAVCMENMDALGFPLRGSKVWLEIRSSSWHITALSTQWR